LQKARTRKDLVKRKESSRQTNKEGRSVRVEHAEWGIENGRLQKFSTALLPLMREEELDKSKSTSNHFDQIRHSYDSSLYHWNNLSIRDDSTHTTMRDNIKPTKLEKSDMNGNLELVLSSWVEATGILGKSNRKS
jgi:hypothetical protein